MKQKKQKKVIYQSPVMTIVEIESEPLLVRLSGYAPDSDDSEFGAPEQRRGQWGNLWNK